MNKEIYQHLKLEGLLFHSDIQFKNVSIEGIKNILLKETGKLFSDNFIRSVISKGRKKGIEIEIENTPSGKQGGVLVLYTIQKKSQ